MKKLIFPFFIAIFLMGGVFVPHANAQSGTIADLQAQIQQLLNTIAQLQAQVAALSGQQQASQWCHTFNTNLRFGDKSTEVQALQTALNQEGFYKGGDSFMGQSQSGGVAAFGEATASAVVGFQQKYQQEVLAPYGLQFGTGFVGTTTRAKLNSLYGCGIIVPPPPPSSVTLKSISPSSGPVGTAVTIYGSGFTSGGNTVNFGTGVAAINLPSNGTSVTFTAPYTLSLNCAPFPCGAAAGPVGPGDYKVSVTNANGTSNSLVFTVPAEPNSAPVIDSVEGPSNLQVSQQGTWIVKAHDPDSDKLNYYVQWEAGGGTQVNVSLLGTMQQEVTLTHAYQKTGLYTITFKVTDSRVSAAFLGKEAVRTFEVRVGDVSEPSITVLSPNGGEQWVPGKSYQVKWDGMRCEKSCNAFFNLTGNGSIYPLGIESIGWVVDHNEATVKVSEFLPLGSYRLQMTLVGNGVSVSDSSDGFIGVVPPVAGPSITVTSPNGGETWKQGTTQTIRWDSTGNISNVAIKLVPLNGTLGTRTLGPGSVPNTGSYSWAIPDCGPGNECSSNVEIPTGAYSIKITDSASVVQDESDKSFSIVASSAVANQDPQIGAANVTHFTKPVGMVVITAKATDPNGDELAWRVSYGDGSSLEMIKCGNPGENWEFRNQHTYPSAGSYTIRLTVKDCRGGEDMVQLEAKIVVYDPTSGLLPEAD